jgi:hypothetical protein
MAAPRKSAVAALDARLQSDGRVVATPDIHSFRDFLEKVARVPNGRGEHGPYTFAGREALIEVVETIDIALGSKSGKPLPDCSIALAGGAQFGKSVTELNLGAYCTSLAWLNWGFYLPDADLVEGMVDTKFRPDILDQLDWFAKMTQVGRAVNKSGRAVNRKGAFTVTDGKRQSQGMIIGLNKVPTSFTFDVTTLDEVDDIKPKLKKFVRGRMTSSRLRLSIELGTQRIAGRGMNKSWKDGSQGVMMHRCPACGHELNLEESWPQCCRLALDGTPQPGDPFLTNTGDFRREENGPGLATHDPENRYYFACTRCGSELDRVNGFRWTHRRPEQVKLRNWSFRISQFGIPAIDVSQIVADWARAVVDPEIMVAFCCDRKAMPESTAQKITPAVLDRSRAVEIYDLSARRPGCAAFGGIDTGRRCWFFAREVEAPDRKRLLHAEQIAIGNLIARATALFPILGLTAIFIDQAPETDAARTIALRLNGLEGLDDWPKAPETADSYVSFPSGLRWNGPAGRWENLRCAVVAFNLKKLGSGIRQGFDRFEKDGRQMFVPLIEANRYETIDRVVREFLTPAENVSEVFTQPGAAPYIRSAPSMRLPRRGPGSPSILETLDTHLLAGSEREELPGGEMGDYADQIENHLLLCDAYSGLAELVVSGVRLRPFAFRPVAQPSQQAAAPGMDGIDDQFVRSPRGREVVI